MTDEIVKVSVRELAKDLESCDCVTLYRVADYYRTDDDGKPLDPTDLLDFPRRSALNEVNTIEEADFVEISKYVHSGYPHDTVYESNFHTLQEADSQGILAQTDFGYSTGLAFALNATVDEDNRFEVTNLVEMVKSLDDYPLLDEGDYSERCVEAETQAWEDYGRSELQDELKAVLDTDFLGYSYDFDAEKLDAMAWEARSHGGIESYHEVDSTVFNFDKRWIQSLTQLELIATGVVVVDWEELTREILQSYVIAKDLCASSLASVSDQNNLNECWDNVRKLSELLDSIESYKRESQAVKA